MTKTTRSTQVFLEDSRWRRLGALLFALAGLCCARAEMIPAGEPVEIVGRLEHAEDISGVETLDDLLLLASDEGSTLQILEPVPGQPAYRPRSESIVLDASGTEIDIEGLARQGETIFVIGSHARVRPRLEPSRSRRKNRERLTRVVEHPARDRLFRLRPVADGGLSSVESISLRPLLERDPYLGRFTNIPGKENGVNIEALASDGRALYIGFRSPVLRGGHVPVMVLDFARPQDYELRFVNLQGRGVRGLTRVEGGFLLLAGGRRTDGEAAEVFFWNGKDCLPGREGGGGRLQSLGEIPAPRGGQAEGLALTSEGRTHYDVIVVYDGVVNGSPRRFRITRQ